MEVGSREVCKAAIQIALTDSREEEIEMKANNKESKIAVRTVFALMIWVHSLMKVVVLNEWYKLKKLKIIRFIGIIIIENWIYVPNLI